MIRLCVLGTSHVGALRRALDGELDSRLGVKATFFPHAHAGLLGLVSTKSGLVPNNRALRRTLRQRSGGDGSVRFDDYDAFCVYGGDTWMGKPLNLFRHNQPFRYRQSPDFPLISEPAFRAIIREIYESSVAVYVTRLVVLSGKPVVLVPSPMTTAAIAERPTATWVKAANAMPAVRWLRSVVIDECRAFAQQAGVIVVLQPDHTLAPSGFTKIEYGRGFGDDPPVMDGSHMNAQFGAVMLETIVTHLRQHRV